MNSRQRIAVRLCVVISVFAAAAIALQATYAHVGRTPGELMDYADRRLMGHPRLELVAHPVFKMLRDWLDEPSLEERQHIPFFVPRPPALKLDMPGASLPVYRTEEERRRVVRVGPLEQIKSIAEAARVAKNDDVVEIQAGEYHGDTAVWHQSRLTIRGVGGHARLFADGKSAEGKALWVIRNGSFEISNIDFMQAKVDDKNGAGIRFEGGHLRIKSSLFWGNENGILASSNKEAVLEIADSEFGYNGAGDGRSHHIYAGEIASVHATGNYFHHANVGHLLKSRAARNDILYNRLTDESGGRASYELDLPNGGIAVVMGNIIQQDRATENSTLIGYGLEGLKWPENRLYLVSNTLVNDHPYGGTFLRVAPTTDAVLSANNLLIGKGAFQPDQKVQSMNDTRGGWELFQHAANYDYRLNDDGRKHLYQTLASDAGKGVALVPTGQYEAGKGVRTLNSPPAYAGALQNAR